MRKLLVLALKEVRLAFRDAGALLTMLITPVVLTLAIAAAFGTGGNDPISDIPVLLLNQDTGTLSPFIVQAFYSEQVGDLVRAEEVTDEAAARARVEADEVAALVVIPSGFSERVAPAALWMGSDGNAAEDLTPEQQRRITDTFAGLDPGAPPVVIEIYASPDWRISTAIVKSIVSQVLEQMNVTVQGIQLAVMRLAFAGKEPGPAGAEAFSLGSWLGERLENDSQERLIDLAITWTTDRPFSWLDYSASSMAVLFLMFAVTSGGRTLLLERRRGTLARMLVMPVRPLTVLLGKMAGVYLAGVLQMIILWGATSLIGAYWGPPLWVLLAILALVLCATGVGALISAWARTPGQAAAIGSAVTLTAAALSGSFLPRSNLPLWVQRISMVAPNAWGIEIFTALHTGSSWSVLAPLLGGLALLTLIYYAVAVVGFRRQFS